jgi:hypothetical protein
MLENAPKYSRLLSWAACVFWIFHGAVELPALADTSASQSVDSTTAPRESKSSNVGATKTSRLEIVFGGSLCPVCLVAFQRRLSGTAGVIDAKVESLNVERAEHSGHPPKRARAVIEFAPEKITKSELETIVRQNDFQFIKAQELPATNP